MKRIALAPAALGLVLAATPALANTPQSRTVTITAADLDLATPEGQKQLNGRVNRAIREVCQTRSLDAGSRILTHDAQTCIAKARASASKRMAQLVAEATEKGG